jgi:hypothetical protein
MCDALGSIPSTSKKKKKGEGWSGDRGAVDFGIEAQYYYPFLIIMEIEVPK